METPSAPHYRLLLMRHAQAVPISATPSDYKRSLTDQGLHQAKEMGSWLRERHLIPDHILSSSSLRTRETTKHLGLTSTCITYEEGLYGAMASEMLSLIKATQPKVTTLLVVAHNPSISQLASRLAGQFLGDFVPAACAILEFDPTSWSKIDKELPTSVGLHSPFTSTS
jgi:phosphohistidine phosphatase